MGCGASSTKKPPQSDVASPTAPGAMNQTTQMNKQTDLQAAAANVGRAVNEPSHTAAMTDTQRMAPGQNGAGMPPKKEEAKPADKPTNEYDRMVCVCELCVCMCVCRGSCVHMHVGAWVFGVFVCVRNGRA